MENGNVLAPFLEEKFFAPFDKLSIMYQPVIKHFKVVETMAICRNEIYQIVFLEPDGSFMFCYEGTQVDLKEHVSIPQFLD